MTVSRIATIASLLALTAGQAFAAAAPGSATPPANFAAPPGPAIAGVCAFSFDKALGESLVGKALAARLGQLASQVEVELKPELTAVQTEAQALEGQRAALQASQPAQFEQRANAVNAKIQAYRAKEELRARELDQTRNTQLSRVIEQMKPLIVSVYTARQCSVVVNAESLIAINPAMDISDDVVKQLNTKMATITFDREKIDPNAPPR